MLEWSPIPGTLAAYIGRSRASNRNVRVIAEGVGGRFYVEAIGKLGTNVRFTVKRENLVQPQPNLFGST